jgi:hypothetical protein
VELYRQKKQAKLWHDYGPTLAMEELAEQHGIAISRESLRKWLIEAKLWRPGRVGVEQAHVWRARRAGYGELGLLVHIQSDVIHMSFEEPPWLWSESTWPLSSAFLHHVLLVDLTFKQ